MKIKQVIVNNKIIYRFYKTFIAFYFRRIKKYNILYWIDPRTTLYSISGKGISFFGYYNISPINENNNLIYCTVEKEDYKENLHLYCDSNDLNLCSKSWNWQQGCMLQWYSNNEIIFNDYDADRDKYISIIYNIKTKDKKQVIYPIYSLAQNKEFALSLNFSRLSKYRPDYGYFNKPYSITKNNKDGLFYIDLNKNKFSLILSYMEIFQSLGISDYLYFNKIRFNHIVISPDDKKCMFLLRYENKQKQYTKLLVYYLKTQELECIHSGEMISHCCWFGNNKIISFCRTDKYKDNYVLFDIKTKDYTLIHSLPKRDGHPSVDMSKNLLITDTYPDKYRMSSLILYNFEYEKSFLIGKFYQPPKFVKQKRIDLHPKWSLDGDSIYFESGHSGKRKLYNLYLADIFEKK